MDKSYAAWIHTRQWCVDHPHKKAAIVSPQGTLIVSFTPSEIPTVVWDEMAEVTPKLLEEITKRMLKK